MSQVRHKLNMFFPVCALLIPVDSVLIKSAVLIYY